MKIALIIILAILLIFIIYRITMKKKTMNAINFVAEKQCLNNQLAAPPQGKQYTCVDGSWILTDK